MAKRGNIGELLVSLKADLGQLKIDVKNIESTFKGGFDNIQRSAASLGKNLAASLGVGLSVGAVIGFGKSIVNLAGQLQDLSEQTGISGQTLSGIKSTLDESGTSLDAFAKGVFTAQKELGQIKNQSDPAAQAVKALGLNLDQLRNADTDTFLKLIVDALGKIENPMQRNALGAQLLGKSFRELGPAIQQLVGRLDELKKSGMSEEDIARLDAAGDAWTRFGNKLLIVSGTALAKAMERLQKTKEEITEFSQFMSRIGRGDKNLGDLLSDFGPPQGFGKDIQKPKFIPPVDTAAQKAMQDLIASVSDANDKLKQQLIELTRGKQAGEDWALVQLEAKEASKGMSGALLHEQERRRALTDDIREQTFAFQQLKALVDATRGQGEEEITFGLTPEQSAQALEALDAMKREGRAAGEQLISFRQQLQLAAIDTSTEEGRIKQRIASITVEFAKTAAELERMGQLAGASQQQIAEDIALAWKGSQEQIRVAIGNTGIDWEHTVEQLIRGGARGITDSLRGVAMGTQSIGDAFKSMGIAAVSALSDVIFQLTVIEPLIQSLKGSTTGGGGGSGSGGLGIFASIIGFFGSLFFEKGGLVPSFAKGGIVLPHFAEGGPVPITAHGGEFIMNRSAVDSLGANNLARMNSTGSFPGGVTVVQHNNIDARGAQRGVSREIRREMERQRVETIKDAVAAVADKRRRSSNYAKIFQG